MRRDPSILGRSAKALGLTVVSTLAFGAVAAQAATVSAIGGQLTYTAGAGEANVVRIFPTEDRSAVIVTERGTLGSGNPLTLTRGEGCTVTSSGSAQEARCAGVTSLIVNSGDLNDTVINDTSFTSTIDLGDGDDIALGGFQNTTTNPDRPGDTLTGGNGNDRLNGRAGNDVYRGGAGDDFIDADEQTEITGAAGADDVDCGPGTDFAYSDPSDTVANCENPRTRQPANVADIAPAPGTPTGTTAPAQPGTPGAPGSAPTRPTDRQSRACANRKRGTRKGDKITGTRGGDRLFGLGGNDVIKGLAGDDCLYGGAGSDRLSGGAGKDRIYGGSGNDVIAAKDGTKDTVVCGGGRDRATVDRIDRVVGCERVKRS